MRDTVHRRCAVEGDSIVRTIDESLHEASPQAYASDAIACRRGGAGDYMTRQRQIADGHFQNPDFYFKNLLTTMRSHDIP